jgi:beta-glucosidase/6-phospho-beta-glucosidase/beta-galactosidase
MITLYCSFQFDFYRFSVSWSRILPTGDITSLNEKGVAYYNRLIDALVADGIQPVITMYHWDLPLALQTNLGGMANPLIVDYFRVYADILFSRFGDRVKHWITFNEPIVFCTGGYGNGVVAPLVYYPGVGEYLCAHHVLLSHAAIYELYESRYRATQNGKIGISLSSPYFYTENPDGSATNTGPVIDRGLQYLLGWFAHPIFSKTGGYPQVMVTEIAKNSAAEGRPWSRLPTLTPDQQNQIQGSADFFGLNYYTSLLVKKIDPPASAPPSWDKDQALSYYVNASWPVAKSSWLHSVPNGLGDLLRWIKKEYDNPEVWITENGWSDDGTLEDVGRIKYVHDHLTELQKTMVEDGCNVKAYTIWSLIDNFEWLRGYS